MKIRTFYDLGIPSTGQVTLKDMAEHRNPLVVALATFLADRGKYLPEDRFDVRYILQLASFVEPMGGGKKYDFSKIRLGSAGGNAPLAMRQARTQSESVTSWQVFHLRERTRAVEALAVKKMGYSEGRKALGELLNRSHTFGLD